LLEALGTGGASPALEVSVDIGEVDLVVLVETDVAVTHEVEL
jgi:Lhr-like helicase